MVEFQPPVVSVPVTTMSLANDHVQVVGNHGALNDSVASSAPQRPGNQSDSRHVTTRGLSVGQPAKKARGKAALADLANFLSPSMLVAGLLFAGCLLSFLWPARLRGRMRMDPASLFVVAAWWLVRPLLFMLLSRTTATGAFVSRYLASPVSITAPDRACRGQVEVV